jgi:hypothetical protein
MSKLYELTLGEAKKLAQLFCSGKTEESPFEIGSVYLIRTVTMIDTGRVVRVTPTEIVLEEAAWIADTGRFSDALKALSFNEVEPFPDGNVIVGRGAIIDACKIKETQRSQK